MLRAVFNSIPMRLFVALLVLTLAGTEVYARAESGAPTIGIRYSPNREVSR